MSEEDILSTIKDTTASYLVTLSATYNFNLTVTTISNQDGFLTIRLVVLSDGQQIDLNERQVIDEIDKEIELKYEDKVDLQNPNQAVNDSQIFGIDTEYLFYGFVGMAFILLCCGFAVIIMCIKLRRKSAHRHRESEMHMHESEIVLSEAQPQVQLTEAISSGLSADMNSDEGRSTQMMKVDSVSAEPGSDAENIDENDDDDKDLDDMYINVVTNADDTPTVHGTVAN